MKYGFIAVLFMNALIFPTFSGSSNDLPDKEMLKAFLHIEEEWELEEVIGVTLQNKEQAFLARLLFPDRGRCCPMLLN